MVSRTHHRDATPPGDSVQSGRVERKKRWEREGSGGEERRGREGRGGEGRRGEEMG